MSSEPRVTTIGHASYFSNQFVVNLSDRDDFRPEVHLEAFRFNAYETALKPRGRMCFKPETARDIGAALLRAADAADALVRS